ncbi:hypothetical protein FF38_06170 [Lucilia cuprina]|uniref:Uncharacterized protein n=1 Tax=Lucilia cuprina TaxID=7375 RepID=A0A0L0C6R6_LUCCU|nr:hypothetical protein FF38_06170 [Lucilia cuprina]
MQKGCKSKNVLSRLMPNVGGSTQSRTVLLSRVTTKHYIAGDSLNADRDLVTKGSSTGIAVDEYRVLNLPPSTSPASNWPPIDYLVITLDPMSNHFKERPRIHLIITCLSTRQTRGIDSTSVPRDCKNTKIAVDGEISTMPPGGDCG